MGTGQATEQQLVRAQIAIVPDAVDRLAGVDSRADAEQEPARLLGEARRILVIGGVRAHPRAPDSRNAATRASS